jgi:hypothetical protein
MTLPNYPEPAEPGLPTADSGIRPGAPDPSFPVQPAWAAPSQPGWTPPPGYPPYPGYVYAPARPTNGMAIASMVVSIAAFLACGGILGIVGALLGHTARKQIRERGEEGDGMALAGIIVGWIGFGVGLIVVAIYVVMFAAIFSSMDDKSSYYDWLRLGS